MNAVPGTAGYAAEADELAVRYESFSFEETHRGVLKVLPVSGRVLDIGAGTGRDAAGFVALGHDVLAVEPTAEMRAHGQRLHPDPRITWLDDSLPDLVHVRARGERFPIVMLTAVWMHLDEVERGIAMPHVAGLVAPGGCLSLSLRHGPVPPGRRMFDIGVDETLALAAPFGLTELFRRDGTRDALRRGDVTWSRLVMRKA
ncbi:class I SAM-dependent methyltransferase [Dongia rigui]|uniref:Class I SAM-dependent methyltransferase n=1 Tax=Dongia rigui TaxID=940149 RepID=A0ABU5E1S6_9PROT|nr:class I SAM-dependent methyltransferase [Dongia rigui]MDY0873506.1 class I SAM-dependent methyltransferase [Dongia rigui]